MAVQAVMAAVGSVAEVGKTIAEISDIGKRRKFEQALQSLNIEEQRKINDQLLKANTQAKKLEILSQSLSDIKKAEIQEQGKKETRLALIVLGGGLLLIAGIYLLKKK